jgi:hypothetical protein
MGNGTSGLPTGSIVPHSTALQRAPIAHFVLFLNLLVNAPFPTNELWDLLPLMSSYIYLSLCHIR